MVYYYIPTHLVLLNNGFDLYTLDNPSKQAKCGSPVELCGPAHSYFSQWA